MIGAQAFAQQPAIEPVTLPSSETRVIRAAKSGREYQIFIALPENYSKDHAPYPVLYAADANYEFLTLVETVRLAAMAREIPELIVVGIGYRSRAGGIAALTGERLFDLTPTRDEAFEARIGKAALAGGFAAPERTGGGAEFHQFLRADLIPFIERTYNAAPGHRGWFGHSAGGLFGTYLLFAGDGLFNRFVLGSPYLVYDKRSMFDLESKYAGSTKTLAARVFFAAGAREPASMVQTLNAFVDQMQQRQYQGLEHRVVIFDGEGHDPVIPATISRGIRYLYAPPAKASDIR